MILGVFGGSFDPPHIGHLVLAQSAMDGLGLDEVAFIPANVSPFKPAGATAPADIRCEMTALAVSDHDRFSVDCTDALREGPSWTIDTLRRLRAARPDDTLVLIVGADAFADFGSWKDAGDIVTLARIGVARRDGFDLDLSSHPFASSAEPFDMPLIGVSSTRIREFIRTGRSIRYLVPWTVRTFIEAEGLYR